MKEMIARLLSEGMQKGVFRALDLPATVDCILVLLRKFAIETGDTQGTVDESGWVSFILNAVKA
jgi:hypothetical protein